eukprot:CAMPEP_0176456064 /NCGR_PEP_ID=MMETSP0127-20121128/31046_1 /TAXON_ID=938130 /ORGANISM="Platyophrya macrostoma, Strain WH" /LENGTH=387 /DNA_ID=CAMNT_0017845913 /DNA_START=179 /DNA_END=1342 /DNA_ORIENTATION=+
MPPPPPLAAAASSSSSISSGIRAGSAAVVPGHNALVVLGTYHSVMAGLVLRANQRKMLLKFSVKHHVGCVTRVAVCDKYLATTGSDERLFLFTAKDRGAQISDLGSLAPASEVTAMAWHGNHFLVVGCADGTVGVYRSRDWESVLAVEVHEKPIADLALHPTGPLAVTVAMDRQLALIDMSSGRLITRTKLPVGTVPVKLCFSPGNGSHIVLVHTFGVMVFETRTFQMVHTFAVERQPANELHCGLFVTPEDNVEGASQRHTFVVGDESGNLRYISIDVSSTPKEESADQTSTGTQTFSAPLQWTDIPQTILDAQSHIKDETKKKYPTVHATRVKALGLRNGWLISADANGCVLVGVVDTTSNLIRYVCSANCQGRITHLDVLAQPS